MYFDKMTAGKMGQVWPLRKGDMLTDFYDGFKAMDLGGSAAQSVVLMVIVVALTVVQFRFVEKKVNY